jgi:hypothetical protein
MVTCLMMSKRSIYKKSIFIISDKPSRCVAEWVDVDSTSFVCSALVMRYLISWYWRKELEFLLIVSYHDLKN